MVLEILLLVSLAMCICMHTVKGVSPYLNSGAATGPPQPLESLTGTLWQGWSKLATFQSIPEKY